MNEIPYKTYLTEDELPTAWYNVRADMAKKPAPLLDPATRQPVTADALERVFCRESVRQHHRASKPTPIASKSASMPQTMMS